MQNQQLESNVLAPLRQWIAAYRAFKDKLKTLDNTRLEFDAERRAFSKLDIKRVRQQQAADKVEPELAGKLEAKSGDVAGMHCHVFVPMTVLAIQIAEAEQLCNEDQLSVACSGIWLVCFALMPLTYGHVHLTWNKYV